MGINSPIGAINPRTAQNRFNFPNFYQRNQQNQFSETSKISVIQVYSPILSEATPPQPAIGATEFASPM